MKPPSLSSVNTASTAFAKGLRELTCVDRDGNHVVKACLVCDKLLAWNDIGFIPVSRLKTLQCCLEGDPRITEDMPTELKSHYKYSGRGQFPEMRTMLLSPRGVYNQENDGFNCCHACVKQLNTEIKPYRVKLPTYAIASGHIFGAAPPELEALNDVELALVAKASIDKHVFTYYGGAHQSMRGWHNMYENDTQHTAGVLRRLSDFGVENTIVCILHGPFTDYQESRALERTTIRPHIVLAAMKWLTLHNRLYKDFAVPRLENLPTPVIINESKQVESQNNDIESRFEYTVVFPETDDISRTNGGNMTQDEFKGQVIDSMDVTNEATLIFRPTQNRLQDYNGNALMLAFPLQFPFGYGDAPVNPKTNRTASGARMEYIKHLMELSLPNMHRGAFVLVLHGMYERHRAVTKAYLTCTNPLGNSCAAEEFADISVVGLKAAFAKQQTGQTVRDPVTRKFLNSINAVCKSMGHTNDAAKAARLHMFANNVQFGTGSLFLSVTPDDGNSMRLRVFAQHKTAPSPTVDDPDDAITADIDCTFALRLKHPGLCAFEFQQITELIIEHVLGWDRARGESKPGGGAFGKLDAWCAAVEEQGRKSLHHHWILWVDGWSDLLCDMHSTDPHKRSRATTALEKFIQRIMSNELFGATSPSEQTKAIEQLATQHKCTTSKDTPPTTSPLLCCHQDLRNLRFQHGTTTFGDDSILRCPECDKCFTAQQLVDNVLQEWFGGEENLQNKLRLAVKRYASQQDSIATVRARVHRDFMVAALYNLHDSNHKSSCFKKGYECRFDYPERPCPKLHTHYDKENEMAWWTWTGIKSQRHPFLVESKRHIYDVFMNTYNRTLSNLLGCNSNIQCGIDGGHIMYVTYYSSKGTQAEDQKAYLNVAATLYKRLIRQAETEANEEGVNPAVAPTPFAEGYRRLLSAVFTHTRAHVASAPMAWFVVHNDGRFLFSHHGFYVPLDAFMGRAVASYVQNHEQSLFIVKKQDEYIYRPAQLRSLSLYDFSSDYEIIKLNKKKKPPSTLLFDDGYAYAAIYGVVKRSSKVTPLVSYLDFPNTSGFNGNLLDENCEGNPAMERFAKAAYTLLVPFHDPSLHSCQHPPMYFLNKLRKSFKKGEMSPSAAQILQNVQDCRNLLGSGRQKDMLARSTFELPPPKGAKRKPDHDEETQLALNKYLEESMTDFISLLDDDNALSNSTSAEPEPYLSMIALRRSNHGNIGSENIITAKLTSLEDVCSVPVTQQRRNRQPSEPAQSAEPLTKRRLTSLLIQSVRRNVENIEELDHINVNGTVESIREWAKIAFYDKKSRKLDSSQQRAFEVIMSMFVLTFFSEVEQEEIQAQLPGLYGGTSPSHRRPFVNQRRRLISLSGMDKKTQLIMFLTGAGGSGKTRVHKHVLVFAKRFCHNLSYKFDRRTIVMTALSGVAATLINGETVHSAAHFQTGSITNEHILAWKHARMIIVDEVSFARKEDLVQLNQKLGLLKQTIKSKYGNIHVVFSGDFAQLEPVGGKPLYYDKNFALWHDYVNCFIELTGQHRFRDDPLYGNIMKRFREGCPTKADFEHINSRVVGGSHPNAPTLADIPPDVSYAVFENRDRTAINNGVFMQHVRSTHSREQDVSPPRHTVMVRSDDLTWQTSSTRSKDATTQSGQGSRPKLFSWSACLKLWTECSDSDVKTAGSRPKSVDVCLKLYNGVPLMHVDNSDVPNGIANGTLCHLVKVHLYNDVTEEQFDIMRIDGYYIRCIPTSCVESLECRYADGSNRTFHVYADTQTCKINMPIELLPGEVLRKHVRAKINRFPLLINHASTGHKLQGQTKESIFASVFHYAKNWPYVVLGRVRSLQGLFLREPLDPSKDFSVDPRAEAMISHFENNRRPEDYDDSLERFA